MRAAVVYDYETTFKSLINSIIELDLKTQEIQSFDDLFLNIKIVTRKLEPYEGCDKAETSLSANETRPHLPKLEFS